ncbi:hypothetical protein TREMEDRAFT_63733 [Tremella mesenterica DSM 1558]|uniref:uncharacterized protein n=1 Tax=Tremella mesenterica (strain ATCC 24925 / CBS 8224 / DSM 1558 / NBRC 9311 / NRRL Y-6157 / RJB 2259-6 / UBC 559-6) TaxID=578456 RepID=UPI0003F49A49|nr:uncharacterized protein TREMEDRAFT_63733 [Tremella mesenterica DSM 1558]EIW67842.1 hypothetical protein TREMEDRAFT_63733 [Tremella mesenterica DSM 1558]
MTAPDQKDAVPVPSPHSSPLWWIAPEPLLGLCQHPFSGFTLSSGFILRGWSGVANHPMVESEDSTFLVPSSSSESVNTCRGYLTCKPTGLGGACRGLGFRSTAVETPASLKEGNVSRPVLIARSTLTSRVDIEPFRTVYDRGLATRS